MVCGRLFLKLLPQREPSCMRLAAQQGVIQCHLPTYTWPGCTANLMQEVSLRKFQNSLPFSYAHGEEVTPKLIL